MKLELRESLAKVDPSAWDALVGDGLPFLEWGWLASLEDSGCVGAESGWLPKHLTVWDGKDLVAACPLYLKGHSQGEFVFDHSWAEAANRAGIAYFPKLLVAVPFTPATGVRFLTRADADRGALVKLLGAAVKEICSSNQISSVHVNFCSPDEVDWLGELGYERRVGYQFQWNNPGWSHFDDYLAALRSKRRRQIRRELRELDDQGITIHAHEGPEIDDDLFEPMFRLYKTTIDKLYWGRQYLNLRLFELLRERWKHRLCFMIARRAGEIVGGTFNVRKGDVLYGRYWGAFEELRYLHFNVCYYATIDHCLRTGIKRFEPGAGGEFKFLRGFLARPTDSMHFIAEPRLAAAVRDFLRRERRAVEKEIDWMNAQSPLVAERLPSADEEA